MRFPVVTRHLLVVVLVTALAGAGVVGLAALTSDSDGTTGVPAPQVPREPQARPAPLTPARPPCVTPAGARERDVDPTDPPDSSWPVERGREVVVHFAIEGLPRRYANAVRLGARLWSRSPCVEAVAVDRCPPRVPCSTVATRRGSGGEDVDGSSESTTRRGVRIANEILLYPALLDSSTDNAALGTVVHEMGHALNLRHRKDPRSIMHFTTGRFTDPRPDAVDFANLAVLYGERVAG